MHHSFVFALNAEKESELLRRKRFFSQLQLQRSAQKQKSWIPQRQCQSPLRGLRLSHARRCPLRTSQHVSFWRPSPLPHTRIRRRTFTRARETRQGRWWYPPHHLRRKLATLFRQPRRQRCQWVYGWLSRFKLIRLRRIRLATFAAFGGAHN